MISLDALNSATYSASVEECENFDFLGYSNTGTWTWIFMDIDHDIKINALFSLDLQFIIYTT